MSDSVATFTREGLAYIERHPELNEIQKAVGGMAWGMFRAVLECPDHDGAYRVPLDREWVRLVCPVDGAVWDRPSEQREPV